MNSFSHLLRATLLILCFTSILTGCFINIGSLDLVTGNGNVITRERQLSAFTKIENSSFVDVEITTKSAQRVELTTDENIQENILMEVVDNTLRISTRPGTFNVTQARAKISVQTLESLKNTGSGDASASPVEVPTFAAVVTGSGDLSLRGVNTQTMTASGSGSGNILLQGTVSQNMNLSLTGSGNATLQGTGNMGMLTTSGSGDISGQAFTLQRATVRTSGSGNIRISVVQTLDATASGSGDIIYYGNPTVTRTASGSGRITRG